MRLLDKYILKAFVGPFLFGVFAFTSIFIGTGTLFRIAQYITEYGAPLLLVMKAFFLAMPSIILLTFPMSVLLGSLMAFSRLSSTSEIVVMRAGGLSFLRLAMPVYILALLISIGAVAFNEFVVPRTNNMYQTIVREQIMKNIVTDAFRENFRYEQIAVDAQTCDIQAGWIDRDEGLYHAEPMTWGKMQ